MHADPQVIARDMVPWLTIRWLARCKPSAADQTFRDTRSGGQPGATFGHTAEVLAEYGYSAAEIDALAAAGAIHWATPSMEAALSAIEIIREGRSRRYY